MGWLQVAAGRISDRVTFRVGIGLLNNDVDVSRIGRGAIMPPI